MVYNQFTQISPCFRPNQADTKTDSAFHACRKALCLNFRSDYATPRIPTSPIIFCLTIRFPAVPFFFRPPPLGAPWRHLRSEPVIGAEPDKVRRQVVAGPGQHVILAAE